MKKIDWEDKKKKKEAYSYLALLFGCTRHSVSQAMNFRRNSAVSNKMRYLALNELGGRLLSDTRTDQADIRPIKVLDRKGNIQRVINKKTANEDI